MGKLHSPLRPSGLPPPEGEDLGEVPDPRLYGFETQAAQA